MHNEHFYCYSKAGMHALPSLSRKYLVLKEFQCRLVLRHGESKSWLIMCRCSWDMLGMAW